MFHMVPIMEEKVYTWGGSTYRGEKTRRQYIKIFLVSLVGEISSSFSGLNYFLYFLISL